MKTANISIRGASAEARSFAREFGVNLASRVLVQFPVETRPITIELEELYPTVAFLFVSIGGGFTNVSEASLNHLSYHSAKRDACGVSVIMRDLTVVADIIFIPFSKNWYIEHCHWENDHDFTVCLRKVREDS